MPKLLISLLLIVSSAIFSTNVFAQQLMPAAAVQRVRQWIPEIADEEDNRILNTDSTTVFYTSREISRAYQISSMNRGGAAVFSNPLYNISGDNNPPFFSASAGHGKDGNANVIFPWQVDVPGGTQRCRNIVAVKAFWLPKREDGRPWPVALYSQRLADPINPGGTVAFGWMFPVGTRFYEILGQQDSNGTSYVFEVRRRQRRLHEWDMEVYRPFPSSSDLEQAIVQASESDASVMRDNAELVEHLRSTNTVREGRMADSHNRSRAAIRVRAGVDELPPMTKDLAVKLLTTTEFLPISGGVWKESAAKENSPAFAPTTTSTSLHIVPAGYDGTFLGSDNRSCMTCHKDTNIAARTFDRGRGWYGHVSGSDGILSWQPSELRTDTSRFIATRRMRSEFLAADILEPYSPDRHPSDMYQRIEGLR